MAVKMFRDCGSEIFNTGTSKCPFVPDYIKAIILTPVGMTFKISDFDTSWESTPTPIVRTVSIRSRRSLSTPLPEARPRHPLPVMARPRSRVIASLSRLIR